MAWFSDRLVNLVSGLGTTKDKSTALGFGFLPITNEQIQAAYRGDWIARKIIDIPAFDMIREGRNWQAKEADIELLEAEEARLQVWPKLARALRLARLWGGSAMIIGAGDADPSQPLNPSAVAKGGIAYLHAVARHEITAGDLDRDPSSPNWGEPKMWTMSSASGQQIDIHPSRVIAFIGNEVSDIGWAEPWGDSVLQVVDEAVKNAGLASAGIAGLIQEAKVDVFKIKDFMANVGDETYREKVLQRVRLANQGKSITNALLMDAEEDYQQKQVSFTQLPEVLQVYLQIASGAADIPATRLLGQSPAGMSATGESDLRNYYDRLASSQEIDLRPRLSRLDEVLIPSALGSRPPEIHYAFAALWQVSEKEKADIFKTKADAARTIAGSGGTSQPLMPIEALSDALVNALVEDGSLPGLEAAMAEYGKLSEQDDGEDEDDLPPMPVEAAEEPVVTDAAPRTLYVHRKLLNAADLVEWAKAQGFGSTLRPEDMHVTVTFSRQPVDWMKMGENWSSDQNGNLTVEPGGARLVEPLGDKGAVVLLFNSSALSWRHQSMREAGASWDFPEYQPHVTITYSGADVDLAKVEPYRGKLVFGPEVFEPLDEDWAERIVEA